MLPLPQLAGWLDSAGPLWPSDGVPWTCGVECTRGAAGTKGMVDSGHIESSHPAHRITKLAESIDLPVHRWRVRTGAPARGPVLIAGRGLEKRHPRSSLFSFLRRAAYLLLGVGITILAYWLFLALV